MSHSTHAPFQRAPTVRTGRFFASFVASLATSVSRTRPSTSSVSRAARPPSASEYGPARRATHEDSLSGSRISRSSRGATVSGTASPEISGLIAMSPWRTSTCRCGGPAPLWPLHATRAPAAKRKRPSGGQRSCS
jgi:hypothetical protein